MNYKTINLALNKESNNLRPTIIALGDFDGVHVAHRQILNACVNLARKAGAVPCVWSFSSPVHKLSGRENGILTSMTEKTAIMKDAGIQTVFFADFNSFCYLTPAAFIDYLKEDLHCVGVACGFNFTFGKNKAGSPSMLEKAFPYVQIENEMVLYGQTVSSSVIRELLLDGSVEKAAEYLGRAYDLTGVVVSGNGLGHKFGYPTANVEVPREKLLPKPGVYRTLCKIKDITLNGITDVGIKPTVSDTGEIVCETYIPGWNGNLYGEKMTVSFLNYLRQEKKFSDTEELIAQIRSDVDTAARLCNLEERHL